MIVALASFVLTLAVAAEVDLARKHFDEGVALLDAKDHEGAIRAFEQSLRARETMPALYNLALAYRATKSHAASARSIRRFLELAAGGSAPEVMIEKAKKLEEELSSKVARWTLVIGGESTSISLDGRTIGEGDGTYPLILDPGPHQLVVERAGYETVELERAAIEGSAEKLELRAGDRPLPVRVELTAEPSHAELVLDDRAIGRSPHVAELAPGPHRLQVSAEDHTPAERAFLVEVGKPAKLHVALEPESESVFGAWWFWTAVGVVVVAGSTAAALATIEVAGDPNCGNSRVCVYPYQ